MAFFKKKVDKLRSKDYILRCSCHAPEHQVGISWFPGDPEVYFHYHISLDVWWKRIGQAVKHIFGFRSKYGQCGELVLFEEDVDNIINVLKEAKADSKNATTRTGTTQACTNEQQSCCS